MAMVVPAFIDLERITIMTTLLAILKFLVGLTFALIIGFAASMASVSDNLFVVTGGALVTFAGVWLTLRTVFA